MSSSSNARGSLRAERRTTTDNGSAQPRDPSGQQGGRSERPDPRRAQSPQPSTSGQSHKRTTSGLQRTNRGVDERRTERVQVTTRETLTSRLRSPERRPGPQCSHQNVQGKQNQIEPILGPSSRAPKSEVPKVSSFSYRQSWSLSNNFVAPWNPEASLVPHTSALWPQEYPYHLSHRTLLRRFSPDPP